MGSQIGNQKILWRYKTALIAKDLATMQHDVLYPGVYSGMVVSIGGSGLDITAGELLINSVADTELVKIVFQDAFNIPTGLYGTGNIFVVVRFTWFDTETGYYAEVLIKDDAGVLDTDLVLAVLEWDITHTSVVAVDNSSKTFGINVSIDEVILGLKVTSSYQEDWKVDVATGNFVFSGANVVFAGGTSAAMTEPIVQRCDVIGIDSGGNIVIDVGVEGSLIPNTYGNYLPVAEVKLYNGRSLILQDNIVDVRPRYFFGGVVAASSVSYSDAGDDVIEGANVQIALSGLDNKLVANQRIIYLGKHGSDSNAGTSWFNAKLTLGAAITAADGLSPATASWVQVVCFDAGTYILTANTTLSSYISVDMRNAVLDTDAYYLTVGNSKFQARRVENPALGAIAGANIRFSSGVTAILKLDEYVDPNNLTSTSCITVTGACDIIIDIGETDTYGNTIEDTAIGRVFVKIHKATQQGSAYVYHKSGSNSDPGSFLDIGYIYGAGASSSGIYADKYHIMANIGYIKCLGYAYNIVSGGNLHLFANVIEGGDRGVGGQINLAVGRMFYHLSPSSAANVNSRVLNLSYAETIVDRASVKSTGNFTNSLTWVEVPGTDIIVNAPDIGTYRLYIWVQFRAYTTNISSPSWYGDYHLADTGNVPIASGDFTSFKKTSNFNFDFLVPGYLAVEEDIISVSVNEAITRRMVFKTTDVTRDIGAANIVMMAMLVTRNSSS